jgi:small subunit ribosomal protein S16
MGAKKRPIYRLVAIDSRMARDGRFVDQLGHYDPLVRPASVRVDEEKIYDWLRKGAEPSDTVNSLFTQIGLNEKWDALKKGKDVSGMEIKTFIAERKKKRKKTKAAVTEEPAEEAKAEAPAEEAKAEAPAEEAKAEAPAEEAKSEAPAETTEPAPEAKKAEEENKE